MFWAFTWLLVHLRVNRAIETLQHLLAIAAEVSIPPKLVLFLMQLEPSNQRQFQQLQETTSPGSYDILAVKEDQVISLTSEGMSALEETWGNLSIFLTSF